MKILTDPIAKALSEAMDEAVKVAAERIVECQLLNQDEVIKRFSLTRSDIPYISPTMLEGRSKPLYSVKSIAAYIKSKTRHPRKSRR